MFDYDPKNVAYILYNEEFQFIDREQIITKREKIEKKRTFLNYELDYIFDTEIEYSFQRKTIKVILRSLTVYFSDKNTKEIVFSDRLSPNASIEYIMHSTNLIDKIVKKMVLFSKPLFKNIKINLYHIFYTSINEVMNEANKEISSIYKHEELDLAFLIKSKSIKIPEDVKREYVNYVMSE